jgi:phosphoglycolate phosphatase
MRYRAAILDLDGTLLDTLADLAGSMNEALADLGFPTHAMDCYRTFVGEGILSLVARTLPAEHRDEATVLRATERYRAAYARNWANQTQPYEGIPEALAVLQQANVPLTVLSNKPHHFTKLCIEHFFPANLFQVVLGQRDEVPRKPDPAAAFEIATQLGLSPREIAFIGDTDTDINTGRAAGMDALGVAWGFRPVSELIEAGASGILHHPSELVGKFL